MFRTVPLPIIIRFSLYTQQWYRGADKSLARPGRKQAPKYIKDVCDFSNIETRVVIICFFLQGKAPKEIHAILTEILACFLPGRAKDLSASLYSLRTVSGRILIAKCQQTCMTYTIAVCTVKSTHDGRRNCPKHVEFYSENKFEKFVRLVSFIIRMMCLSLSFETAEMKLLRPLAVYTLYDHKTNDYIRRELRIRGILDKIDEYRRNWLSHLQRMPQSRILLKLYHYRPQGRRTIGRPKKRWREQL